MFIKSYLNLICLLPFALAGCSGSETSSESAAAQTQLAIQPGDWTNQVVFPNADSVVECNMHDGFTSYVSGQCEIFVQQQCAIINEKCHCKVKVLDTAGPCANKQWKDFYPSP